MFELYSSFAAFLSGSSTQDMLAFGSIPIMASLIGYGTNVLAIQMTFLPLEYIGFYESAFRRCGFSLGWQGIIPANAAKIAHKTVTLMTEKLFTVQEVFARVDRNRILDLTREPLISSLERILDKVGSTHAPTVWESLSLSARTELAAKAAELSEPYILAIFDDLQEQIEELLDIYALTTDKLVGDPELMNEVFKRCGAAEFRFVERSGFYFGFLLGCLQAVVWWALLRLQSSLERPEDLPLWWFLPVAGAMSGYVTNAIALWLIFNPIDPVTICGVRFLGLFLQRQREVSREFAVLCASRIITAQRCWDYILYRDYGRTRLEAIVRSHTMRAIDEQIDAVRLLVPLTLGAETYRAARQQVANEMLVELPRCLKATYSYTEEAMGMDELLETRMSALRTSEYERLLHPAFEEDEWKLIAVGGLLGMAVGFFQLFFVFSSAVR